MLELPSNSTSHLTHFSNSEGKETDKQADFLSWHNTSVGKPGQTPVSPELQCYVPSTHLSVQMPCLPLEDHPHPYTLKPFIRSISSGPISTYERVKFRLILSLFSCVWLFVTPWTIAHQGPLSIGFSRQEYWSGLPFPLLGDLPDPRIKPESPTAHYLPLLTL